MSECPECQHEWASHAGASPWLVSGCADCIAEEDYGQRSDVCGLIAPESEQKPAARRLHARLQPRRLRGDRVLIEDELRYRWAELRSDGDLLELLAAVDADLAVLAPIPFARKYRQWMTERSFAAAIADRAG